jgi:K+-transporting ATPase A subunit
VFSLGQYLLFVLVVTLSVKPLGGYMERVFSRRRTVLDPFLFPLERRIYRISGVDPRIEMSAGQYASSFIIFSLICTLFIYAILRFQHILPWFFPQYHTTPLTPDLSFNTAISFSTTTTWQAYAGENTMSYFSQMVGLCTQNFLAGAAGLAVGIAFIRGLARESCATLGNFWVDLTRSLLWILLPGALVGSLLLVCQGVPMNFHHYVIAKTLEGTQQVIPQGPVAALGRSSRIWAQMAEDSSMRTGSSIRESHADHELPGVVIDHSAPGGPDTHIWPNGTKSAPGLALVLGDAATFHWRLGIAALERAARESPTPRSQCPAERSSAG